MGFRTSTRDVEAQSAAKEHTMKREAAIAGLASEGLALILGSAGAGSSAVVGRLIEHKQNNTSTIVYQND